MARDNFSPTVKAALAKRAGYRCSFPGCPATTVGPSDESSTATSNTGEAAHINSASGGKGARRHDPSLSPEQRSSIDNGVWCCNVHAELIDTDEVTYTVGLLKSWRRLAELKEKIRQAHGNIELVRHPELTSLGIAPDTVSVSKDDGNEKIGRAVEYSCIREIWGKPLAGALRDFLIEHSRNVLSHGQASAVEIKFSNHCVEINDNGAGPLDFAVLNDPDRSRGGGMAYRELLVTLRLSGISASREDGINKVYIPLISSAKELPKVNPCAVFLSSDNDPQHTKEELQLLAMCDRVYVIAPDYTCFSDSDKYEKKLVQIIKHHPNVTIVLQDVTVGVLNYFRKKLQGVEVVAW